MTCAACLKRGQTWSGSAPACAFEGESFSAVNWNCATVNAVRDLVYEGQKKLPYGVAYQYCEDQKYATVYIDHIEDLPSGRALTLWVTWYKSRGGTDALWLLDDSSAPRPPTEADCLAILAAYGVAT